MIPCSPLATKPQRDNYTYPAQELSISTSAKVEALRFKNFDKEKTAVFRKSGNRHRKPAYHRMAEVVGRDLWRSSGWTSCVPLCAHCPLSWHGCHWNEPGPIFFATCSGMYGYWWDSPWASCFPGWAAPALSAFLHRRCSSPFIILVVLCWTLSLLHAHVSPGEPKTGHCTPGSSVLRRWRDHIPEPAFSTWPNATQGCHQPSQQSKGTLLAHVQRGIHQSPKFLFHKAVFQPVGLQHAQVHRFFFWALSEDRSDIFFPPVLRNFFRLPQLFKDVPHNVHILIWEVGQAASWTLFSAVPGCMCW